MGSVDELIRQLETGDAKQRREAARALRDYRDPRVVDALIRAMLVDAEPRVREDAASSLGKIGDPKVVPVFADVLSNDDDDGVRQSVVFALEEFADDDGLRQAVREDALYDVADALVNDPNYMVRVYAAHTLGKIGDSEAADALHNALDDSKAEVRYAAVVALGKIGTEDAIESLIYALENDEEAEIRFTAAQKLYELGAKSAWSTFKRILDVEQSHEIQEIAVRALGKWGYGKPDVVDKLIAILESYLDYDEKVRAAAAESLGKLDDPYALHALFRAGENDRSNAVRNTARQAYHALFLRSVDDFLRLPEQERHELGRELQDALREHFVKTVCEYDEET